MRFTRLMKTLFNPAPGLATAWPKLPFSSGAKLSWRCQFLKDHLKIMKLWMGGCLGIRADGSTGSNLDRGDYISRDVEWIHLIHQYHKNYITQELNGLFMDYLWLNTIICVHFYCPYYVIKPRLIDGKQLEWAWKIWSWTHKWDQKF